MKNIESVTVVAPARLHMGFLDPSASLNRKFGSVGVALNEIATRITVRKTRELTVRGELSDRVAKSVQKILEALQIAEGVQIDVENAIPEHVGLGSGTQMSLAIGLAVSRLFGLELSIRAIAGLTDRGCRSGIGIGVFERGGLIVDGGRAETSKTPPVIARIDVPAQWRFILVFDHLNQGLNGSGELDAFRQLTSFPEAGAARICHLLLMQGLPALAEQDIENFGNAVTQIQQSVGAYFATVQGGHFTSPDVAAAIDWLARHGAVGCGQSSWGPTGFCMVEDEITARKLVDEISALNRAKPDLQFQIVSARNAGGDIGCREAWSANHEQQPTLNNNLN